MKKQILMAIVIAGAAMISSCTVITPHCVTAAPIGDKIGESSRNVILGFIYTNKNWGIAEAAKNGGIKGGIGVIDFKSSNYVVFKKQTFIVYGSSTSSK